MPNRAAREQISKVFFDFPEVVIRHNSTPAW